MAKKKATKKITTKKKPEGYVFGRPTKYESKFCQMLIDHMKQGLSFETFAAVAKVNQDTLHRWAKTHPDFYEAKKQAFAECQIFWEKLGVDHIINKTDSESNGESSYSKSRSLNSAIWVFNMKNRFKWRDKQPDEDNVNVTVNLADKLAKARARANKK